MHVWLLILIYITIWAVFFPLPQILLWLKMQNGIPSTVGPADHLGGTSANVLEHKPSLALKVLLIGVNCDQTTQVNRHLFGKYCLELG